MDLVRLYHLSVLHNNLSSVLNEDAVERRKEEEGRKRTFNPPACNFNLTFSPTVVVPESGPALCPFSAPNLINTIVECQ